MSDPIARHAYFSGRVQGVWFRGHTCELARQLEVRGWVRNRRDGRVEALFVAPANVMDQIIRAASDGPRLARVDDVQVQEVDIPENLPLTFTQLPTE